MPPPSTPNPATDAGSAPKVIGIQQESHERPQPQEEHKPGRVLGQRLPGERQTEPPRERKQGTQDRCRRIGDEEEDLASERGRNNARPRRPVGGLAPCASWEWLAARVPECQRLLSAFLRSSRLAPGSRLAFPPNHAEHPNGSHLRLPRATQPSACLSADEPSRHPNGARCRTSLPGFSGPHRWPSSRQPQGPHRP